MTKKILLAGSLSYDYIMDFPDSFKNHILPEYIHILNVCFMVDKMKENFGGTTGNIAYNLKLLGTEPLIMCPLGKDGQKYRDYLEKLGIETKYIPTIEDKLTASAHVTTDKDDNQITAFYNGALFDAVNLSINDIQDEFDLAFLSPNYKEAMVKHAKECFDKKLKFVFDPGQQITAFNQQELLMVIGMADYLIANDYEMKLIQDKTGLSEQDLVKEVEVLIKTLGEKGSVIYTKDELIEIEPCRVSSVEDPTGAGDAYRGGFFTAFCLGYDLQLCGQFGSVAASYAIEKYGTQNHSYTKSEFKQRFFNTYNKEINF